MMRKRSPTVKRAPAPVPVPRPGPAAALPKGSDEFVEAFARGLAVIRAFGDAPGPLSMTEVARRAGLTRAGARRLLLTLTTLGYARQSEGGFALGPRVLELGFAYLASLSLREAAQPSIERFARETGELAGITVLDGADVIYVARAEVRSPMSRSIGIGSRLPAYATATGRALLTGLADDAVLALVKDAPRTAFTRHTLTDPARIAAEVAKARRQGYALVPEELELGVCGLALPLRDAEGAVIAAVNSSVSLARHDQRSMLQVLLPKLKAAAAEIELGLTAMSARAP